MSGKTTTCLLVFSKEDAGSVHITHPLPVDTASKAVCGDETAVWQVLGSVLSVTRHRRKLEAKLAVGNLTVSTLRQFLESFVTDMANDRASV